MKANRRVYITAKTALRLGGDVSLSFDREVIVDNTFIGTVNRGQATKLEKRGAKISRNAMWREGVIGGHLERIES